MKNRFYSLPIKAAAIVLAVLIGLLTVFCGCAAGVMLSNEFYTHSLDSLQKTACRRLLDDYNYQAYQYVMRMEVPDLVRELSENYFVQITNREGQILYDNLPDGVEILLTYESVCGEEEYLENEVYYYEEYTVTGYLKAELTGEADPFVSACSVVGFFHQMRYWVIVLGVLGLLVLVVLIVFLFCSAGNSPGAEKPKLNPLDVLPFDAVTFLLIGLAVLEWNVFIGLYGVEIVVFLAVFGVVDFLLVLWYFLSLATRLKVGCFWRTTLIGKLCTLLGKGFQWVRYLGSNLPLVWKTGLLIAAVTVAELIILLLVWNKETLLLWWLLEKLVLVPLVLFAAISLRKLQKGGEQLAKGSLDARIDLRCLTGDLKKFGHTLNSIGDGMNTAVEERMRSERFKTELITNVSHDIKTPLTSIINYVDLIKKEEPENEEVRQYVEVLDRQSARLKKLIEDLVEASKASTGNLQVHPEPCDMGVLLTQMVGEYDERLRERALEPVLHQPDTPIMAMADPRHLWRILDNLMVNVLKYAQEGTRVYLDLFAGEREIAILFRNISKAPLNITGDELMERFVRGDSSRNTEGSGLGLSIARSLTELQGGRMQIDVDGDLFKVTLRFPRLS
ncbi:MAG: sensor histidine kinase [Clostridia bacterium]|nr:sensor histidine kinase [Clostridia bacterium]